VNARLQEDVRLGTGGSFRVVRRALGYVAPFRREFAVKAALLTFSLLPQLLLPWPIKLVIDHVIGDVAIGKEARPYPFFIAPLVHALAHANKLTILIAATALELMLLLVIGAFGTSGFERSLTEVELGSGQDSATQTENQANFGFSYVSGLLGMFEFRWTMRLSQMLNHHYRSKLYERVQALPMATFDDERIGDAVYRVMYDTPAITLVCLRLLLTPIAGPLNILLTVLVLASVYGTSSPVVLLATLFLPMVLLVTWPFAGLVRRSSAGSRSAGSVTASTLEEGMSNITAVQSLGGEGREHKRFDQDSAASFKAHRRQVLFVLITIAAGVGFGALLVGRVFLYVGDQIIDGSLSAGDVGVLIPYFSAIAYSAGDMGSLWFNVQGNAAGLNRVFWLMDLPSEQDPPHAKPLPRVRDSVRVDHVSFEYDAGHKVLTDVSFEAKKGELTAFVGPAGAGKTTLAYMIPRFLSPTTGKVLVDGVDVATATRASLRSQVAFVFQETTLFDTTIAENLRLGNANATDEQLMRAATTAGIADFIQGLPQGLQTRLGRAGGKLSVGQKQRLSIARALVCDAPIMIFDEPTSALDPETEGRVVQALEAAARERIVLVIAHRLSTVRGAAQILFLQDGKVLERGTHRGLMANLDGPYHKFVQLQTHGLG
jgi:ABC-type multidrug transport system fused ATPase/permease subunit